MYRILLVDDEALIREGVSENVAWEKYGYEFAGGCENGKEALDFIVENPVDVVLTDICMPYLDGIELSERIHDTYPDVKVIILSGYDEFEYAKRAISYGVKEYLLKPITAQEMGEVLERLKQQMDEEQDKENKMSRMSSSYHKGQMLMYTNVLLHLIMGRERDVVIEQEMCSVGLELQAAVYRVAIIELDIYARRGRLDEEQKKESALMAFVLYNISQEIVKRRGAGEVCQGKDNRTFILFHADKHVGFKETVKQVCRDIIVQINESMQLAVNIGIGNDAGKRKDIYVSYEEAEEALSYRYTLGGNEIIEMETIQKKRGQADMVKILDWIVLHVKENDKSKIQRDFFIIENILRDYCYDRQSAENIFQRILGLLGDLRRMSEMGQGCTSEEEILRKVFSAGELAEAVDILNEYCINIAESLDNCKNVGGKKYAVLAMDYIAQNYTDYTLSLNSVCSYLNISTSRFSSIFKQVTGNTFMDVLSGLRMQKAKELLENTDLKNYEIAEKVGFNNPHYFSIAFKKIEGRSPTEYAKEMRK